MFFRHSYAHTKLVLTAAEFACSSSKIATFMSSKSGEIETFAGEYPTFFQDSCLQVRQEILEFSCTETLYVFD